MDALSYLLRLAQVDVSLDVRCLLAGSFVLNNSKLMEGEHAVFHFLLAGQCRLQVFDEVREMHAGDFVLLPHGTRHELSSLKEGSGAAVLWREACSVNSSLALESNLSDDERAGHLAEVDMFCGRFICPNDMSCLVLRSLPPLLHVNVREREEIAPLVALMRQEIEHGRQGGESMINALGEVLLVSALRAYGELCGKEEATPTLFALLFDQRLHPLLCALLEAPEKPWTVTSMAALLSMSRATLERRVQERARMSVGELLLNVRMMQACSLLRRTDKNIVEIAGLVGYGSETAFAQAFARLLDTTPGRWRNLQRQAANTRE